MRYYVANDYKKPYNSLVKARAMAIKQQSYGVVSIPINDENNISVGRVYFGYYTATSSSFEWRTTYRKFNPNLNEYRRLEKRWVLHKDGTLGKRII